MKVWLTVEAVNHRMILETQLVLLVENPIRVLMASFPRALPR
jgi:hypothetical protein